MENSKNTSVSIALILILTITITAGAILPIVHAADVDTYAFIALAPTTVGVDQTLVVSFWLNLVPPTASGAQGDRWENMTIEVIKPDGTEENLGPFKSDPVGAGYTLYTPNQIGSYSFQIRFPGQQITGFSLFAGPIDNWYRPSNSNIATLTVQQDPLEPYPNWPLPQDNEYWERPIEAENRDWWQISGNWLQGSYNNTGPFNPYTKAPNTGHIVWTKEIGFGGIIGGDYGSTQYYEGLSYENKWDPPIIMQGRLYYNTRLGSSSWQGLACVDLRTGEQLWWKNGTTITMGQIYDYNSPNQHGGIAYLWSISGSTWKMYDAFTGDWILDMANASSGTIIRSPAGDILVYMLNGANNWLAMWNSSSVSGLLQGATGPAAWSWRPPQGATLDWQTGIQWNVTVPDVPGSQSIREINSGVIYATNLGFFGAIPEATTHVAYDATTGLQLWVKNQTDLPSRAPAIMANGVYTEYVKETMQWYGYDIFTGNEIWVTDPYTSAWGMYRGPEATAYGKLYGFAYDGMIHCYDLETGNHEWDFWTGNAGFETPYGHWPFFIPYNQEPRAAGSIADGKIFAATNEHSPTKPLWRGGGLYCVNASTGDLIWKILGWYQVPAIADGYLVTFNGADHRIYCYGKGPSKTTVTTGPEVSSWGSSVLIKGSVTDESPGTKEYGLTARLPNGVPAIADEYMSEWMQFLHMQKPCPENAEGVEVVITTYDPNGNTYELGRTTTSVGGTFGCEVNPPVPGLYRIIATFEGTESYFGSFAETYLVVEEAPSPAESIEPELATLASAQTETIESETVASEPARHESTELTEPTVEAPLITTEIAIIVAVAVAYIIGIIAFLALRKRK